MYIVEMSNSSKERLTQLVPVYDIETHEQKTLSDDILHSSGVFSCIALAAYNPRTKRGILGQFSAISSTAAKQGLASDNQSFKKAVDNIQWLGDPASTRIWLGGGAPRFNIDGVDEIKVDRDYAEERVRRFTDRNGLTQPRVTTNWVGDEGYADMTLNCELGVLAIENLGAAA